MKFTQTIQTLFILAFSRHKTFLLNISFFKLFIDIKFPLFQFILIYVVRIFVSKKLKKLKNLIKVPDKMS